MIFSRGKIWKLPTFTYNGKALTIAQSFSYLGVQFNYNAKLKLAQTELFIHLFIYKIQHTMNYKKQQYKQNKFPDFTIPLYYKIQKVIN